MFDNLIDDDNKRVVFCPRLLVPLSHFLLDQTIVTLLRLLKNTTCKVNEFCVFFYRVTQKKRHIAFCC